MNRRKRDRRSSGAVPCAIIPLLLLAMSAGCQSPSDQSGFTDAERRALRAEGGLVAPPSPPPTADPHAAYKHGVQWIIANQNDNGSWGSFESARPSEIWLGTIASFRAFGDACTALCAMALQEPSRTDPDALAALEKGLDYLLAAPPIGRATGEVFYDTWAHTYITEALVRLHRDDRFESRRERIAAVAQREIILLVERQGAEGGWGYYDFDHSLPTPTGAQSTSFNTASALLALHQAREAGFTVPERTIHDALFCLERLRLPNGAYVYGTYAQMNPGVLYNRPKGSLGRSQPCNLALWTWEMDITPEEMLQGLANLRNEHHFIEIGKGRPYPHEAWYYTAGYYFHYGHFYAARVLATIDAAEREDYAAWLARTMWRLQDSDGSWFDFPLYGYHKAYGTAFAVMTLEHAFEHTQPSLAANTQ